VKLGLILAGALVALARMLDAIGYPSGNSTQLAVAFAKGQLLKGEIQTNVLVAGQWDGPFPRRPVLCYRSATGSLLE
jgi:hypothetical protein